MNTRIQLSLYVPGAAGAELDAVRRVLDPVQARLIPAHLTLCREDELDGLDPRVLRSRLATAETGPLTLRFGPAEAFQGHGVLLPCVAGEAEFQALRRWVLGPAAVRRPAPHITLAHPRNPKASTRDGFDASLLPSERTITFTRVSRIQQAGPAPWLVLEDHDLASPRRDDVRARVDR